LHQVIANVPFEQKTTFVTIADMPQKVNVQVDDVKKSFFYKNKKQFMKVVFFSLERDDSFLHDLLIQFFSAIPEIQLKVHVCMAKLVFYG
jgi:hypothetical protein